MNRGMLKIKTYANEREHEAYGQLAAVWETELRGVKAAEKMSEVGPRVNCILRKKLNFDHLPIRTFPTMHKYCIGDHEVYHGLLLMVACLAFFSLIQYFSIQFHGLALLLINTSLDPLSFRRTRHMPLPIQSAILKLPCLQAPLGQRDCRADSHERVVGGVKEGKAFHETLEELARFFPDTPKMVSLQTTTMTQQKLLLCQTGN